MTAPSARVLRDMALVTISLLLCSRSVHAQGDGLDSRLVALTYHKVSGEALDVRAATEQSEVVRRASNFDRPDVVRAETARLEGELAAAAPGREFVVRVSDNITEYDHDRGEFSAQLFRPGFYVQVEAFRLQYRLVFANAEAARAIPMPKDEARAFDARLNETGRGVTNEIHFRIIGAGDPAGAVTGPRVIRGEILSARLLDREGRVVFTPRLTSTSSAATATAPRFDATRTDVAGLRTGVKAKDFEATARRLFGEVTRRPRGKDWYPGFAASMVVNEMGCYAMPGRGRAAEPGAVCVTAFVDEDDVVRSVRIERVFPWLDAEVFRATLVRKYGAVADAKEGGGYSLGWGPAVDPALVYDRSGPHTAVTAHYVTNDDPFSRGGNALPRIRVVLQLVDAQWAAAHSR